MEETMISVQIEGQGKKATVKTLFNGKPIHLDSFDPKSSWSRGKYLKDIQKKDIALDQSQLQAIDEQIMAFAHQQSSESPEQLAIGSNEELLATMPEEAREQASAILNDPELIRHVLDDVSTLGVAGEKELAASIYLTGTSRLLLRPLAIIVQGPSSSGKSYVIEKTAALFPPETVISATQITPQALFYMPKGSLVNRFVVAGERSRIQDDEHAEGTRALREMLSAQKLSKMMPIKKPDGSFETRIIEQDGPISYIESTTVQNVFEEDANRCIMLTTDERSDQTKRIMNQIANRFKLPGHAESTQCIMQRHHAMQRMLKPYNVAIPFAVRLVDSLPCENVVIRRACPQLMSMIQACTILHQFQRRIDDHGNLMATPTDYQIVHHLLYKPMLRALGKGLSDPALRFFERLRAQNLSEFTTTQVKKGEQQCKSSVYGWLNELEHFGLVEKVIEGKGQRSTIWKMTGNMPDAVSDGFLPSCEVLFSPSELTEHKLQLLSEKGV